MDVGSTNNVKMNLPVEFALLTSPWYKREPIYFRMVRSLYTSTLAPNLKLRSFGILMGKLTVFGYLREQWTELPIPTADISDQSLVVVGTNVGLGNETAAQLAQLKPKSLLITSRDEVKCERSKAGMYDSPGGHQGTLMACTDMESRSGMTGIESWPLELCSFDSVSSFVDKFEAKGCTANVLIANAGISTLKYKKTPDGYEAT
jgi:retinol dehydrogenase-12